MPIFDGGALKAQVDAQQAALDQAPVRRTRAAVLTALKDVEDALVALRARRERRDHLQRAAEAAGNASLLARQRYGSGLIDFQTVLDTLRTQLNTQDSLAAARTDVGHRSGAPVQGAGRRLEFRRPVAVQTARTAMTPSTEDSHTPASSVRQRRRRRSCSASQRRRWWRPRRRAGSTRAG